MDIVWKNYILMKDDNLHSILRIITWTCTCQLHKKEKIATKLLYLSPIQSNKCLWSSRTMNILKLDQSSIDCLKTSGQEEASLIQQNWSIPDYYYYYYIHTIGPPSTTSRTVQSKFIANLEFICQWPHILFVPSRALWQMKIDRVVPDALRQQQGGVFGCTIIILIVDDTTLATAHCISKS